MATANEIKRVWNQKQIPVAFRTSAKGTMVRVRLPFDKDNRKWLKDGRRLSPKWIEDRKFWELPKAWFNDFVDRALATYGQVYIIQPYREREVCAPSCRAAMGHECECSCMGENHGVDGGGGWFDVSETFSIRWGPTEYSCRLLTVRKAPKSSGRPTR